MNADSHGNVIRSFKGGDHVRTEVLFRLQQEL